VPAAATVAILRHVTGVCIEVIDEYDPADAAIGTLRSGEGAPLLQQPARDALAKGLEPPSTSPCVRRSGLPYVLINAVPPRPDFRTSRRPAMPTLHDLRHRISSCVKWSHPAGGYPAGWRNQNGPLLVTREATGNERRAWSPHLCDIWP
jgi:hypothetical protein